MQYYDIFMLVVLVGTVLFGFWKGMAWQIASLASVILSAVMAIHFSHQLAPIFGEQAPWNRIVAMLVLYVLTALAIWLVFRLVAGMIDRVKLKEFDHQIGALFGLAKGMLWCIIITFFVVGLSESARQTVLGTYSGRYIAVLIKKAAPVLPEEVTNVLGAYIDELDKKLDPNTPPETPAGGPTSPGMDSFDIEALGKGVIGDLKKDVDQGDDQLRKGLEGKLDQVQDGVKNAVDGARKHARNQIENLPKMGDATTDQAQDPKQGRGGWGSWW
ncbi:MAG: CvpA family protein [Pirellulales bacterium]|nr:CvpA family protein [Pirellulales bacterium]